MFSKRGNILLLVVLAGLLSFNCAKDGLVDGEEAADPGVGTVQKYRLSWRADPATTMTVGWVQDGSGKAKVYYGPVDKGQDWQGYPFSRAVDAEYDRKGMLHQFARLSSLLPETAYYFVVRDAGAGYVSPRFWFLTAPNTQKRFTMISGGDSRNNRDIRRKANQMVSKLRPLCVVFGGDMTEWGFDGEWKAWFNDWQLTTSTDGRMYPIIAARGNHESNNKDIEEMFDVPSPEVTYALTIGGNLLRIYTLNSEISITGSQKTWLQNDLAASSGVKWKMAQYHRPARPHVASKTDDDAIVNNWSNLFWQHGVRLVIESDAHTVKTTWPLRPTSEPAHANDTGSAAEGFIRNSSGTVYVGEGTWGAPLRDADDNKTWTRDSGKFNQFKWMNVTPDKIEIRTVRYENADEVLVVDDLTPFTPPHFIDIWSPANGDLITIVDGGISVPVVNVTNPTEGQFFNSGSTVNINVTATDGTYTIDHVEFYGNGTFLGQDNSFPYSWMWSGPVAGANTITVTAVNSASYETESYRQISVGTQTKSWRISNSSDDAEERVDNGDMDLTSGDIELVYDSNNIFAGFDQIAGLRFRNVDIPQGSTIVNAYIQFTVEDSEDEPTVLNIQGENVGNSGGFTSSDYNLSSRPKTLASVQWIPPSWPISGSTLPAQRTPSIASVVQEIVNHGSWASGNSMSIFIDGSGKRSAESYDGDNDVAAKLVVEFGN